MNLPSERAVDVARIIRHTALSNKEIGLRLNIAERTVKHYIKQWFDFAEVDSRTKLVFYLNCELFQIGLASFGINL